MMKTTTQNEKILNLYNEASEESQKDFQAECLMNSVLSEERAELEKIKALLDGAALQPSQKSIDAILKYSASFMHKH